MTSRPLPSCFPPASTGAASLPPPPPLPPRPTCSSPQPLLLGPDPSRPTTASYRMAATTGSLEAVKRKIQALQQEADEAEDRAQVLQRQRDQERELREKVSIDGGAGERKTKSLGRDGLPCRGPPRSLWLCLPSSASSPRLPSSLPHIPTRPDRRRRRLICLLPV
ncbi:uncharacterized protein LOC113435180 [Pseudonaja textilis]|uniref:uncharacterized protein LOC113435180 n=1 Tax=Pseudonaja textilis TaxID=8673 RepID=UPI000EA99E1A|nr:uncharacterized protein LOC113435180 [Pseudonaja textilis]